MHGLNSSGLRCQPPPRTRQSERARPHTQARLHRGCGTQFAKAKPLTMKTADTATRAAGADASARPSKSKREVLMR